MQQLAKALVEVAAFLDLSSDDVVDPDSAVGVLEQIAAELARATPLELNALREVIDEKLQASQDEDEREFYESFFESFGLDDKR
ncbi:hypothetical protein [Thalassoroseus pseudoceratinae]|uniref:hypothetical protein n=1 Tax=Thalassoroseus pseudoceratinae TaxID=2713176 RepID=UPI00141F7693|nr:hypothetical protein [Thalassoroseus pseudoceratinae]